MLDVVRSRIQIKLLLPALNYPFGRKPVVGSLHDDHWIPKKIHTAYYKLSKGPHVIHNVWISDGMSYEEEKKNTSMLPCVCARVCVSVRRPATSVLFLSPCPLTPQRRPLPDKLRVHMQVHRDERVQLAARLAITLTSRSHQYGRHPDGVGSLPAHRKGKNLPHYKAGHFFFSL